MRSACDTCVLLRGRSGVLGAVLVISLQKQARVRLLAPLSADRLMPSAVTGPSGSTCSTVTDGSAKPHPKYDVIGDEVMLVQGKHGPFDAER